MNPVQAAMLEAIRASWVHHPDWTLGKLLQSAMNIARGELRSNPALAKDEEVMTGLKALIPSDWELQK